MMAARRSAVRVLLVLICTALAGCITAPAALPSDAQAAVYTGRFAVTYEAQGAPQREQGGFEWRSFATDAVTGAVTGAAAPMQLLLTTPLGTTAAALQWNPNASPAQRASLQSPQGVRYAASLSDLMQLTLGWELPLQALLPWLGGASPAPAASVQGWGIAAESRHENGAIKLLTARSEARNITLRLVFDAPK